jgi:hypothetical protein
MARSSILGPDRAPLIPAGRDIDALGPSDTSDSGSDVQEQFAQSEDSLQQEMQTADSDTTGTGERASAILNENVRDGGDIAPDRIVDSPDGSLAVESEEDAQSDVPEDRRDAA